MKFAGIDPDKSTLFRLIKRRFEYPVNKHATTFPIRQYEWLANFCAMFLFCRRLAKECALCFDEDLDTKINEKNSKYYLSHYLFILPLLSTIILSLLSPHLVAYHVISACYCGLTFVYILNSIDINSGVFKSCIMPS